MNQILVTEKLYITPELRKKKKAYKRNFLVSVLLVCVLFSYYMYQEYDKFKSEEKAKDILASTNIQKIQDDTLIKDKVLVVVLDDNKDTNSSEEIKDLTYESPLVYEETEMGTKFARVAEINIPKIKVNYSVLSPIENDEKALVELLKKSPCRYWGADKYEGIYDANKVGNFCIAGHNYRNSKFFSKVPTLEEGDIIELTDVTGKTIKYRVYKNYIVDPDDSSCTSQYTNGKKEVTLITCTNNSKQRYIIKATEV